MPFAMPRSISRATCDWISSSMSRSSVDDDTSARRRARKGASIRLVREDETDCGGEALPLLAFDAELSVSGRGELVIAGATIVLRHAPMTADESAHFEPAQRGVHGAVVHVEDAARDGLNGLCDVPAVLLAAAQE